MSVKPILLYPDARLRLPSSPVTAFGEPLKQLAEDVLDTMRAAPGVGMTAAHIGVLEQVAVVELDCTKPVRFFVNPSIVHASAETSTYTEGSVSMPGATEQVTRPRDITVRFQTLDGTVVEEDITGFLATCVQHEIDQLNGIFWLQRLSRLKRERLVRKWEKSHT